MLPVLLDLKFIKIYTFGVFLVLAFFWGAFLLWRNVRLTSYKEEDIFDGLFIAFFVSLFFGRLFYVLLNLKSFGFNILKFILINGYPGLSLYGALFGGLISLYLYLSIKKIKFSQAIDYFISPMFLALALGKLGAFFSGSEIGSKTKFILGVRYIGYDGFRHLTPLYEALLFGLGAYFSIVILSEIRKDKLPKSFLFFFFAWYLALTYFIFDKIKINHLYLMGRSINLLISDLLLLTISVYFLYHFRKLIFNYGKTTYQKITKKISRKSARREKENTKADRGTQKK